MYITPQTNIRLLHNVPIDSSYVHSLFFASASGQTAYFQNLTKYNLNNYTYQRYDKGVLRVQILADNLYDINYMMFQNRAFGNKWFYAFVDKVEYLNDVTTAIYYHIDEIQTWLFDWNFAQCFVERMHTPTDEVGDNIQPEPVEVGEYVYNNYEMINEFSCYNAGYAHYQPIIIVAINKVNDDGEFIADGDLYNGVYSGLKLYAFSSDVSGVRGINFVISEYSKKDPNTIVAIYMCPWDCVADDELINGSVSSLDDLKVLPRVVRPAVNVTLGNCGTQVDGYTVKNKKLLTYPYNFENVINCDGSNLALRYEFFNNTNKDAVIAMQGNFTQPVQTVCYPYNYKNSGNPTDGGNMYDEKLVLANYPSCSWNADAWKVWWSQNAIPLAIKGVESVAVMGITSFKPATEPQEVETGIISGITGKPETKTVEGTPAHFEPNANGTIYALHTISSMLTNTYKASIQADYCKGNISSGNVNFSHGAYSFNHGRMSVNRQQAEIIDNFFDRFGYTVNKLMTPSLHTRTNWTFIKTIDCTIHGSIPRDSEAIIEKAFNNGITFWARPSIVTVGDYSQNNAPLT
jgi:hypothetical protein